jgi:Holliday junction resolvase-like predicted endonuclease
MDLSLPRYLPEANIQAEIYRQCKALQIECYLEYRHLNCRFDVVIVKENKIVGIIEVKKGHHQTTKKKLKAQKEKYAIFGMPLHVCFCSGDIPFTMKTITNWIGKEA